MNLSTGTRKQVSGISASMSEAVVQCLYGDPGIAVGTQRDDSNVPRRAVTAAENRRLVLVLLVLLLLALAGLVAAVELGHDLLVGGLPLAAFVSELAYAFPCVS